MKHPRRVFSWIKNHKIITGVIFIVLIIIGFFLKPSTPPVVETQKIEMQTINSGITASGTVASKTSVNLNFLTGSKLVYLGVKKGDEVKKGQVIATLDQRTVQKNLELTLRDYSKERNDFEQTLDDNNHAKPENAVNDEMKRILQNNQYDLEKAVLSVELQSLAKEQSVLVSPIDGIITRADVASNGVNITSTTIFTIADPINLVFQADIDEADIGRVINDQVMNISLDAFSDQTIRANVSSIDFASHTTSTGGNAYTVEAELPENNSFLYRIGMSGDAEIITQKKSNVLTVPITSIVDDEYVYVKKKDKFEKRKVKLGIENDIDVEVKSGVQEGEEVAIQPEEAEKYVVSKK